MSQSSAAAVGVAVAALGILLVTWTTQPHLAFNWVMGLAVGAVLQRGRFCFAGAFRDLYLMRNGVMLRAILVGLALLVAVFALIESRAVPEPSFGAVAAGAHVVPLGLNLAVGGVLFGIGLLSDLRSKLAPKGGIGLFFGTFNPFHRSHLAVIRRALEERRLDKVVVHPTIVPRLHTQALARGEIHVARVENGMQVYERTEKADVNVDYFPTGRQFFAPEARRAMIELALAEAGLGDKVEIAYMPEIYARDGFHGVIRALKRQYRGRPLHGIHGSDVGAMYLRAILDECGWIYPMPIARRDRVSATAIRDGAAGMTAASVADALAQLRAGAAEIVAGGRRFRNERGALLPL